MQKDQVGYLDNALKRRANGPTKPSKRPLKDSYTVCPQSFLHQGRSAKALLSISRTLYANLGTDTLIEKSKRRHQRRRPRTLLQRLLSLNLCKLAEVRVIIVHPNGDVECFLRDARRKSGGERYLFANGTLFT